MLHHRRLTQNKVRGSAVLHQNLLKNQFFQLLARVAIGLGIPSHKQFYTMAML